MADASATSENTQVKLQHFRGFALADTSAMLILLRFRPVRAILPKRRDLFAEAPDGAFTLARVTIRIDDALYERLQHRARKVGVSVAELLRPAIDQAADPRGGYVYTTQDEILSCVLQTLSIVAASVRRRSPETLEQGMADAKALLEAKGLLGPEQQL